MCSILIILYTNLSWEIIIRLKITNNYIHYVLYQTQMHWKWIVELITKSTLSKLNPSHVEYCKGIICKLKWKNSVYKDVWNQNNTIYRLYLYMLLNSKLPWVFLDAWMNRIVRFCLTCKLCIITGPNEHKYIGPHIYLG